ncbi:MAG: chemotaxis protein CheW [Gemmatimonadota bacterium]|nr:MAG: chemotaxis protein CheW [Gemmatimonadota bacterium]
MKGYLLVEAGGARYGVPLADVRQVIELPPASAAPSTHPAVLGVIQVGGRLMPLVDLGALVEAHRAPMPGTTLAVVTRCAQRLVALAVDDAEAVVHEDPEPLPDGWALAWAAGVAREGGTLIPVIDMDVLAERLVSVGASGER